MYTTVSIKTGKYTIRYCSIEQEIAKKLEMVVQIPDSLLTDKSAIK